MATVAKKEEVAKGWEDKVKIKIPRANDGDSNYLIASVNGRVFKVQRGIEVDVPYPIAKVIENSFKDADEADNYIEKKAN